MIAPVEPPLALVELSDATIRVRDVVPNVRGGAGALPIARLPGARRQVTLSAAALAALVRRAAPGLPVQRIATSLRFRRRVSTSASMQHCFAARVPIDVGTVITRALVEPGRCDRRVATVRYVGGAGVAAAPIAPGSNVGRMVSNATVPSVARGAALTLMARHGVVTIERDVTALQAGRDGGRVFVRDHEGHVFAAPVRVAVR